MRGIGVDIASIGRFHHRFDRLAPRILSAGERQRVPATGHGQWLAGRWAVKEAIIKTGYFRTRRFAWAWIDVQTQPRSGLQVAVYDPDHHRFRPEPQLLVSISHSQSQAVAIAVWM